MASDLLEGGSLQRNCVRFPEPQTLAGKGSAELHGQRDDAANSRGPEAFWPQFMATGGEDRSSGRTPAALRDSTNYATVFLKGNL